MIGETAPRRSLQSRWPLAIAPTLALLVVVAYGLMALLATAIAPYSPVDIFPDAVLSPPSTAHPFGTDANGMDVLSRTIHAARLDLGITIGGVAGAVVFGIVAGLLLGYVGGWLDVVGARVLDVFQAVPLLILAMAILAATRGKPAIVAATISFVYAPYMTRIVRTEAIAAKTSPYVEAAKVVGNSHWRIMFLHILPNISGPIIVQAAIRVAFAIKITAALAFVGVGILPPTPEWGGMIRLGTVDILRGLWWTSIFPGIAVSILILAFTVLADALQQYFNPQTRLS